MSDSRADNIKANYIAWRFFEWLKGGKSYEQIDAAVRRGELKPQSVADTLADVEQQKRKES